MKTTRWYLLSMILFLPILALYLFNPSQNNCCIIAAAGYENVSVSEGKQLIGTTPSLAVLDVRTLDEYRSGYIENAVLIPLSELVSRLDELDKDKPVLVYCRTGSRSATASQILVDNGFSSVYNMLGGITSWIDAGYTVKYSADLNSDRLVNILDITLVATAYNSRPGDPKWNPIADIDKNSVIDILDITEVAKDYGKTV